MTYQEWSFPSKLSFCKAINGFSVLKESLEKVIMTKSENVNFETGVPSWYL